MTFVVIGIRRLLFVCRSPHRLGLIVLGLSLISPPLSAQQKSPVRPPAIAFSKHVVVAREPFAAEAGRAILNKGGNAVDAAVATALALAVTHPPAGNLGGGGFIVLYLADGQKATTFDFRERAPAASTAKMYLDDAGKLKAGHRKGPWAAGVPGTVRGLALAHARYGKLPWAELVEPSERLARDGFPLNPVMAASLNAELFRRAKTDPGTKVAENLSESDRLADFPASVAAYAKADRTPWKPEETLVQPDLAATLKRLKEQGADEFYVGKTADLIAEYSAKNGGFITKDDLIAYRAVEREPIRVEYRGHDVYGMAPPSSGGIITALCLNMLEPMNLRQHGRMSDMTLHLTGESLRRAFYERFARIGDPDFVDVPVARMIDKSYAAKLAASIDPNKATPSRSLAEFPLVGDESPETTHLSVLDSAGNAVALTYTLEESYGAKCVVPGAGFLLNNEMGDFNLTPGVTDATGRIGTKPNLIEPNKRMVSSMTPTIVARNGRVRMVTGSPGGRTIPSTVLWMLLGVLEFELPADEVQTAPKAYQSWFPDRITLERGWPRETEEGLKKRGWKVSRVSAQGDAHSILVNFSEKTVIGLPDKRRGEGAAAGD
jgi:gamma-glutamyltranspeptidase/glutathione hydrolase